MDKPDQISDPSNWDGGFYGLALEMGERDDERLQAALQAAWSLARVEGCYAPNHSEEAGRSVPCDLSSLHRLGQLHGTVELPTAKRVVCGVVAVREEAEPPFYAPDWLFLFVPLVSLGRTDDRIGGYPFGDFESSLAWRRPIDDWWAEIATRLFENVPFRLGLIGMEVNGEAYSDRLQDGVPPERWICYLLPDESGLRYYPATE